MNRTTFRIATNADVPIVQSFIDAYWRNGHILARDRRLLEWQHLMPNGQLNFIVGQRETELLGILGFVSPRRFDPEISPETVSMALWIARSDINTTGVGVGLVRSLMKMMSPEFVSTIGVAVPAQTLLGTLGFVIGEMNHHAVFNSRLTHHQLPFGDLDALLVRTKSDSSTGATMIELDKLESTLKEVLAKRDHLVLPPKSPRYVVNRFTNHPYYSYLFVLVHDNTGAKAVLICRKIQTEFGNVLRCVDVVGDLPYQGLATALQATLRATEAEYLDIVHLGLDSEKLEDSGFVDVKFGPVRVPGFFEPFKREQRVLRFAYKASHSTSGVPRLFLADCDQDRPNLRINESN